MRKINSLIALLLLVVVTTQWSCSAELFNDCLTGSGGNETRIIELDAIDRFELFGAIELEIKEGSEQLIEVRSESNLIDRMMDDSFVENGKWRVGINDCVNFDDIKITATLPFLKGISIDGSGEVKTDGVFGNIDSLELNVTGSGDLKLDLGDNMSYINSTISGSGDLNLTGEAITHSVNISGSADIKSFGLKTRNTDITASGSIDCQVFVESKLDLKISGSGDVCYRGMPQINTSNSGSVDLKDCN